MYLSCSSRRCKNDTVVLKNKSSGSRLSYRRQCQRWSHLQTALNHLSFHPIQRVRISNTVTSAATSSAAGSDTSYVDDVDDRLGKVKKTTFAQTGPCIALQLADANSVVHLYRTSALYSNEEKKLLAKVNDLLVKLSTNDVCGEEKGILMNKKPHVVAKEVYIETCYNIELNEPLNESESNKIVWLLQETFEPQKLKTTSVFSCGTQITETCITSNFSSVDREVRHVNNNASPSIATVSQNSKREKRNTFGGKSGQLHSNVTHVIEVGPRMTFSTAWCTSALAICKACGVDKIIRLEKSRRYGFIFDQNPNERFSALRECEIKEIAEMLYDRMTEEIYPSPIITFDSNIQPNAVKIIPVLEQGIKALEDINLEMGLAFDDWDLKYYFSLFVDDLKRNPTDVELFDIAQSNSEHSRHWFFKAELTVDGHKKDECLFDIVRDTLSNNPNSNDNSVIGFHDNSSAIRGRPALTLSPSSIGQSCVLQPIEKDLDLLLTAETHNFPCAVAPLPGAETGAGGRIRDTQATGRGSIVVASTAGYCVGNLNLPCGPHGARELDENVADFEYPENLASPLQILLDASDGASDYGNKFGEPLIAGFTRTFGMRLPDGTRREWLKPIMFSAGIGQIDHRHIVKEECGIGMLIVKIGGPAYRIGLGGGSASSLASGSNDVELDFNAVQRGDAQMSNKLNRVVRACVEMGDANPIISIHDQGAGGNCNVCKEIVYPKGAKIDVRAINVGDASLSVLEIWGAEYQENDCLLILPENLLTLEAICIRERLPMASIGSVTGDGKIVLYDSDVDERITLTQHYQHPEDMELEKILGDLPTKNFSLSRSILSTHPLVLPDGPESTVTIALQRVLRLPAVGSKRFLTSKVDRSVTGLVAQQQCVGPLLLPLSDYAAIAQSHYVVSGGVTTIGEQPLKGMLSPAAMARLATAEAITNMMFAKVTSIADVKASGNWMYAAKIGGEGAAMYDAAIALRNIFMDLGISIDGGKDSLSMAAQAGSETVIAPGNLVVSAYVTSPDVTKGCTPDLKLGDDGCLLYIDFANGKRRLGGSALAQAYGQLADESPDLDEDGIRCLRKTFQVTQDLLDQEMISAGHDISDGGIITTVLEMAFAGNCGLCLSITNNSHLAAMDDYQIIHTLFAEEPGVVLEVSNLNRDAVLDAYAGTGVNCVVLGTSCTEPKITISVEGVEVLKGDTAGLRSIWEETAFELERLQCNPECVTTEEHGLLSRKAPHWKFDYDIVPAIKGKSRIGARHRICVLREEGSNGDREMAAALELAGMEPWDVTMTDLISGDVNLNDFRACVFVGGFSFADVLDSAKGWAGSILLRPELRKQFDEFRDRTDTISLGVCNGCQLMALLGWVNPPHLNCVSPAATMNAHYEIDTINNNSHHSTTSQNPRFVQNLSGRFESRFVQVRIDSSTRSHLLKGMAGSILGVWCSHGEGRALFHDDNIVKLITSNGMAPLKYCSDDGLQTETYPMNPNGSPEGIAALCSNDGRHTAMMPHPERSFLSWQLPHTPVHIKQAMQKASVVRSDENCNGRLISPSPWLNMFHAMRQWLDGSGRQ